jgi:antirestriction protein ArdC
MWAFFGQSEHHVMNQPKPRFDIAQTVTDLIIEKLEAGVKPWERPWTGAPVSRPLRSCGTPYRGINIFMLWMMADAKGYVSPYWLTYRQAEALGAQVRKGEKASHALFYKMLDEAQGVDSPEREIDDQKRRRVLRSYAIFNADQIDGLPERYAPVVVAARCDCDERRAAIEAYFAAIPAHVVHCGDRAYYDRTADRIVLPPENSFKSYAHYASTRAHETLHWAGGVSRLNRAFGARFGDKAYAFEELVATMGEAALCARFGLPAALLDDHAAYIGEWLTILEGDRSAILTAAAKADEAFAYLDGYVIEPTTQVPQDFTADTTTERALAA